MEKIQEGQPFTIFVECAGTPAQLEKEFLPYQKNASERKQTFRRIRKK